ncbi:MAG: hypothetical protein K0R09_3687, partial [Clostridiales bacterium]|nr:hypothetical protein [Clostridiales bacterium]
FLSNFLPFSMDTWIKVISENVPKNTININIDGFNKGKLYKE